MIFIDSTSNLEERNLKFFILITHLLRGALPLGRYFRESKNSRTVIINTKLTFLECSRSFHAHLVTRSLSIVPGKMRDKCLQIFWLEQLYVEI